MRWTVLMLALLSQVCAVAGCGWDPTGLCHAAKEAVDDAIDGMEEVTREAKEAAKDVVNDLFDRLDNTLEHVEAGVIRVEDTFKNDSEALVAFTTQKVGELTDKIVNKLEEMVHQSTQEITAALDHIINDDLAGLVNNLFSKVAQTLYQFEQFAFQAACTAEGIVKQLELFVGDSMLHNVSDCECVREAAVYGEDSCAGGCTCGPGILHLQCGCSVRNWATVQDDDAFFAIRCKILKEVNAGIVDNRPASWVVSKLGEIQDLADQLHCYHFTSSGVANWYAVAALNLTKQIYIWQQPLRGAAALVPARRRLTQADRVGVLIGADGCGTPLDCYTQALAKLEEAQQLVDDAVSKTQATAADLRAAAADLRASTAALNAATEKFALKSDVLMNTGAQTLSGDITVTGAAHIGGLIHAFTADFDTLTGHAWNSKQLRVMLDGKDGSLHDLVAAWAAAGAGSHLAVYPCNCRPVGTPGAPSAMCGGGQVTVGFGWYCKDGSCKDSWTGVMDPSSGEGVTCCDMCTGSKDQAGGHLAAAPPRISRPIGNRTATVSRRG